MAEARLIRIKDNPFDRLRLGAAVAALPHSELLADFSWPVKLSDGGEAGSRAAHHGRRASRYSRSPAETRSPSRSHASHDAPPDATQPRQGHGGASRALQAQDGAVTSVRGGVHGRRARTGLEREAVNHDALGQVRPADAPPARLIPAAGPAGNAIYRGMPNPAAAATSPFQPPSFRRPSGRLAPAWLQDSPSETPSPAAPLFRGDATAVNADRVQRGVNDAQKRPLWLEPRAVASPVLLSPNVDAGYGAGGSTYTSSHRGTAGRAQTQPSYQGDSRRHPVTAARGATAQETAAPAAAPGPGTANAWDDLPIAAAVAPSADEEVVTLACEPCPHCSRAFAKARLGKHVDICQRSRGQHTVRGGGRRPPDPAGAVGAETEPAAPPAPADVSVRAGAEPRRVGRREGRAAPPSQPGATRSSDHGSPGESCGPASGSPSASLVMAGSSSLSERSERAADRRVECPHCNRRFHDEVAARHIPHCGDVRARLPRAPKMDKGNDAAAAAAAEKEAGEAAAAALQRARASVAVAEPSTRRVVPRYDLEPSAVEAATTQAHEP